MSTIDPYGKEKKDLVFHDVPPGQVRDFHTRSDLDFSKTSQHHTIGTKPSQAAGGDHNHYNNNGVKLAKGSGLVLTGAKGGNVALANLITMLQSVIEFTDNTT